MGSEICCDKCFTQPTEKMLFKNQLGKIRLEKSGKNVFNYTSSNTILTLACYASKSSCDEII